VVGQEVAPAVSADSIPPQVGVGAIAVSADGKKAYIGIFISTSESRAVLLPWDVVCSRGNRAIELGTNSLPEEILLYPDGSKALIISDDAITLVDLRGSQMLASARSTWVTGAVAVNGGHVFAASAVLGPVDKNVFGVETPALENALLGNQVIQPPL